MNRRKQQFAFASDLDGTLYSRSREPQILPADLAAVRAFRDMGGLFGLCTGRTLSGARHCTGDRLELDFIIAESGALIVDGTGQTLYERLLTRELAQSIIDPLLGRMPCVVHAEHEVYSFIDPWPGLACIRSLDEIGTDQIYDISAAPGTEADAAALSERLKERFGEKISVFVNVSFVDIVAGGCSKGNALRELRRQMNINRLAGMGDSYNDLSMVEEADMGFTFPYAPEGLRSKADALAGSVAGALRTFMREMP